MSYSNQKIETILDNLQKDIMEIKNMLSLLTRKTTTELFLSTLNSDEKILAYSLSDGENTSREIANIVNVSYSTVSRWWREWKMIGIVQEIQHSGSMRVKKLFSLDELGIEIPKIQKDDFYGVNNIPDRKDLKKIFADKKLFFDGNELYNFIIKFYNVDNKTWDKEYLISFILDKYDESNNKEKLMLIHALRQKVLNSNSEFLKYFEKGEKNIKGHV
ncbi:MAG: helix-turn-helix domain-containing protein [Candidatus Odinarchaeia archaeon]